MAYLPASRLEKIVILLMNRLGTREILITGEEVLTLEGKFPNAHLVHSYSRISDELTIMLDGIEPGQVN